MARARSRSSFTKVLGKTLCLCLAALAMDLVWGYCGILSLGHFAFFGLGGYMIGMWLMYEPGPRRDRARTSPKARSRPPRRR
jgi:ABC-type branched-subunit amino acid transport system permease subunit